MMTQVSGKAALNVLITLVVVIASAPRGRAQLAYDVGTVPLSLQIVPAQSSLNATVAIDSVVDDSDSDSSPIEGTMEATFGVDFGTGNLRVTDFVFTGGQVALSNSMTFNLDLVIFVPVFSTDITASGIAGVPNTPVANILTTPARPGTTGLYSASNHLLTLNQGTIVATGDLNQTINLATDPISGSSASATPGQVIVTQGPIDLEANTTAYTLTTVLPVGVQEVIAGNASGFDYTATIAGTGSIRATGQTLVFDFVPWNGLAGDINQDGVVSQGSGNPASDDVAAFVAGWRSTNNTPGRLAYQQGDLNFDGMTDLRDAFLLRQAFLGQGAALDLASLLGSHAVPEPASMAWLAALLAPLVFRLRQLRPR